MDDERILIGILQFEANGGEGKRRTETKLDIKETESIVGKKPMSKKQNKRKVY